MNLTPHFTLAELTTTGTGLRNTPDAAEVGKLRKVAELLEVVRAHFGRPVLVHSGYRSPAVNEAVGGSKTSQHMLAEAADFHVDGVPLSDVFNWIAFESGIGFGQVILEGRDPAHPTWVHLSLGAPYRPAVKCGQALRWNARDGYTQARRG